MRINCWYDNEVHVTLSERNLRALLAKLEIAESLKTISLGGTQQQCQWDGTVRFGEVFITAERDDTHYQGREPGRMHYDTEKLLTEGQDEPA